MEKMTLYLRDAASQECQLYTQTWLLSLLNQQMNQLGIPQNFPKPIEWHPWHFELFGDNTLIPCGLAISLSLLYAFFKEFFSGLHNPITILTTPLKCVCIVFIISVAVSNVYSYIEHNTKYRKLFNEKINDYNIAVNNDKLRVQKELQYKETLIHEINLVNQEQVKTKDSLDTLYSLNIIHPKYRNLVAISSFYDYFDTGRCTSLTGPGGAYATFEEDLRFRRIESRLDVIISKLDEIIANQQYLGELMQEANSTLYRIEQKNSQIAQSMNRVAENSELTAYNTRCAAQSSSIIEHISVYYALKNF